MTTQTGEMPTRQDVESFVYGLFAHDVSCRGETEGMPVEPTTPTHDFFHSDVDGIDLCIGKPIQKKYGLEQFGVDYGIPGHHYKGLGDQEEAFYKKYPLEKLRRAEFTLENFAEMIYDFVRLKHGQKIA